MVVRAAGGVLWRRRDGVVEVALVHRPRYGDWSLPKGKLDPGEGERDAALREVAEETGYGAHLGPELGTVRYVVGPEGQTRPKTVRYWAMEAADGDFAPDHEVDALVWLPLDEAAEHVTYAYDRQVLQWFSGIGAGSGP